MPNYGTPQVNTEFELNLKFKDLNPTFTEPTILSSWLITILNKWIVSSKPNGHNNMWKISSIFVEFNSRQYAPSLSIHNNYSFKGHHCWMWDDGVSTFSFWEDKVSLFDFSNYRLIEDENKTEELDVELAKTILTDDIQNINQNYNIQEFF